MSRGAGEGDAATEGASRWPGPTTGGDAATEGASLRRRLFLVFALTALACVAVTAATTIALQARAARDTRLDGLARQADATVSALEATRARPFPQLRVLAAGAAGTPVRPAARARARAVRTALGTRAPGTGSLELGDRTILYVLRERPTLGRIVLIRPAGRQAGDVGGVAPSAALAALAGLLLAAALAALSARRLTRPIAALTAATRPIAAGAPGHPLPEDGPRELAELARAFNTMGAELESARDAERRFLHTVSHELRTPLTSIRGYAEALADGHVSGPEAAPVLEAEAARLERLVGDLLELANLGSAAFTTADEPVDLQRLLAAAHQRHAPGAAARGIALTQQADAPATARGDEARLLQALSNLVENALRVTPRGGRVTLHAAPGLLAVADTGPGLAPEERARAFERFHLHRRSGPATAGSSGLGLALVAELTAAMGGRATAEPEPGGGTRFVLHLRR